MSIVGCGAILDDVDHPVALWLAQHALPVVGGALAGGVATWLALAARARADAARPTPTTAARMPTGITRRLRELEARNLELVRLFVLLPDVAHQLSTSTDRTRIVELLVEHTRELFSEADSVAFFAPPSEPGAGLALDAGVGGGDVAGAVVPSGRGLVGCAWIHNEVLTPPRLRRRLSSFELELAQREDPTPFSAWAAVPVRYGEQVLGVLAMSHPGAFWTAADSDAPDPLKLLGVVADVAGISLTHAANQAALAASNAKLQELDRLKSELVAMVSHDLRTPLTSVRSVLENLRDGVAGLLTERQQQYVALMEQETSRLVRLINALLDLQRIEAGGVALRPTRILLGPLVDRAVKVLAPSFASREIGVDLTGLPPDLDLTADPDRLAQVLFNLLDNAAKFTPDGGRVSVGAEHRGDLVVASVTNTGEPISEADATAIFGRFHQVRRPDGSRPPGAGLGLSIAQRLVGLHGGEVWAQGLPDVGTRIAFSIPLPASEPAT